MNTVQQLVELQSLSLQELLDLRFDSVGTLTLLPKVSSTSIASSKALGIREQAHLRSAYYWLNIYQPEADASHLEKVRGYLEAFDRLCELSAWREAAQILLTPLQFEEKKALHEHLGTWGYYGEQLKLYSRLLGKINSQFDCLCLQGLGEASCLLGKVDEAIDYHQQQLQLARELEDKQAEASALGGLGTVYCHIGQNKPAIAYHQQQLHIAREISNSREEVKALFGMGHSLCFTSQYRQSIRSFQQALKLNCKLQDSNLESSILGQLGQTYCMAGNYQAAIDVLKRSLQVNERLNRQNEICIALNALGNSYCLINQTKQAIQCQQKALKIANEMNYFFSQAISMNGIGIIYSYWLCEYEQALEYFEQAFSAYEKLGDRTRIAVLWSSISYCHANLKHREKAIACAQKSLEIASEIDENHIKSIAISMIANAYWHRGQYARGLLTVARAMLIYPPWKSANGKLIVRKTIELVSQPLHQLLKHS